MGDIIVFLDNHIPKNAKLMGYTFIYERGQYNAWHEKTYKSIDSARKAAMPYPNPPVNIYKVYKDKSGKRYGKVMGFVSKGVDYYKYTKLDDDFNTVSRYAINKDGSLGSRITGNVTGTGLTIKMPKGRY